MNQKEIEEYLQGFDGVWSELPFGEGTTVYKVGHDEKNNGKMFALIINDSKPVILSLRCDPMLAIKLRETYETVMPAKNLNNKIWNTILCTGQIGDDDLKGLIIHSYNLAKEFQK